MILGVLLAAGTGSRFDDGNKLLASVDGEPLVAHSARTLTESSLDAAVAVVGHDHERVERALPDEIETVAISDYEQGQSASVWQGVALARECGVEGREAEGREAEGREAEGREAEAVLFALGDMPCVTVETVEAMLDAFGSNDTEIVAPRYEGQRGNPVLFGSRYFDELASVEGDTGGRALLESEPVTWVDVSDPGIHRDVDEVADLRELRDSRG